MDRAISSAGLPGCQARQATEGDVRAGERVWRGAFCHILGRPDPRQWMSPDEHSY